MKTRERAAARSLRADEGRSVKEIAKALGVSTSTVSRWVCDIELTDAQRQALRAHDRGDRVQAGRRNSERARRRRAMWQQEGREDARQGRPRHMAGCMLFWAEVDLNLFADHAHEQARIERHWLDTLALPTTSLRRSTVNVYSRHSARKRLNRLPFGTCRLSVHSTRAVQQLYGAIQEYGGFERLEWLDCNGGSIAGERLERSNE